MATILLLETSTVICSAAVSVNGRTIAIRESNEPNKHAEYLSVFCDEILKEAGVSPQQLDAVAVSSGPGSYTGLRIATSTAKGYAFTLNIPLIAISTLQAMAFAMRSEAEEKDLLCPMIDARRMEVYSAVYDHQLNEIKSTAPVILTEYHFEDLLAERIVWFSGDGSSKSKELLSPYPHARFTDKGIPSAAHLASLAEEKFNLKNFEDTAYFVPNYLKEFQPGPKRSSN